MCQYVLTAYMHMYRGYADTPTIIKIWAYVSYVAILSGKKARVATRSSMSWTITMAACGRPGERKFSQYFQELDDAAKKRYVQKINSISEKLFLKLSVLSSLISLLDSRL